MIFVDWGLEMLAMIINNQQALIQIFNLKDLHV